MQNQTQNQNQNKNKAKQIVNAKVLIVSKYNRVGVLIDLSKHDESFLL